VDPKSFVAIWCNNHLQSNEIDDGMKEVDVYYVDNVLKDSPSADATEIHESQPINTHRRELSCFVSISKRGSYHLSSGVEYRAFCKDCPEYTYKPLLSCREERRYQQMEACQTIVHQNPQYLDFCLAIDAANRNALEQNVLSKLASAEVFAPAVAQSRRWFVLHQVVRCVLNTTGWGVTFPDTLPMWDAVVDLLDGKFDAQQAESMSWHFLKRTFALENSIVAHELEEQMQLLKPPAMTPAIPNTTPAIQAMTPAPTWEKLC
jgi:hypothetical protein